MSIVFGVKLYNETALPSVVAVIVKGVPLYGNTSLPLNNISLIEFRRALYKKKRAYNLKQQLLEPKAWILLFEFQIQKQIRVQLKPI